MLVKPLMTDTQLLSLTDSAKSCYLKIMREVGGRVRSADNSLTLSGSTQLQDVDERDDHGLHVCCRSGNEEVSGVLALSSTLLQLRSLLLIVCECVAEAASAAALFSSRGLRCGLSGGGL